MVPSVVQTSALSAGSAVGAAVTIPPAISIADNTTLPPDGITVTAISGSVPSVTLVARALPRLTAVSGAVPAVFAIAHSRDTPLD
ncbi:MAG: hypothetical protein ABI634_18260 [Acidobacteriota bacterium]